MVSVNQKPLVSIVIVNWNGLEDTKACIGYTKQQTYKNFETIVVDNGSSDESVEYLRGLGDITLVENVKNFGFTGGHIAGYKVAKGEYILLLNNDAIMDPDYIKRSVEIMQSDEKIGALGGRAYLWDEDNKLFDTNNHYYAYQVINPITGEGIFSQKDEGMIREVNNVSGSCVMVRRSVTEKIGYLHEPFFAYFEESDLFARMKRAGHKVVYSPNLAIWHANAKSSNRKAPTFMYYMLMRNRFRFAVRNFDSWSLRRFLKFYLKMGIVSAVKSFVPLQQRPMHQAYAKAFFYNLAFGWKAVVERRRLIRSLGDSSYNQLIVREQNGVSIIVKCDSNKELEELKTIADSLSPIDEVIAVTKERHISKNLPVNLRFCIDKGYFNAHSENLGAVVAKNEWLVLATNQDSKYIESIHKLARQVYSLGRSHKKLAVFGHAEATSFKESLNTDFSALILTERSLLIDAGGLDSKFSLDDSKRRLIAFSALGGTFIPINSESTLFRLSPTYKGRLHPHELRKELSAKLNQARLEHKKPTALEKIANRYYRVAQLRNLIIWFFTFKIPTRLKLGRIKSVFLGLLTLNRKILAEQLKHMRNEAHIYRDGRDVVAIKKKEKQRLDYLIEHPEETIIFIILRDRLAPLKQLIKWLDTQGLKKIVFVDNDSRLPELVAFLNDSDYQVLELKHNMTQAALWTAGIIKLLLPEDFYILTDPDIIPTRNERDVIKYLYELHARYPDYLKVGLGLKIDDLPEYYTLKRQVIKWESQFWKHPVEEDVYEAGVDTTFAVYKPFSYKYVLHPSLRTGEPYTAQHLPWYANSKELSPEDIFYRLRADQNINSWDTENLPDRYKKELEK